MNAALILPGVQLGLMLARTQHVGDGNMLTWAVIGNTLVVLLVDDLVRFVADRRHRGDRS